MRKLLVASQKGGVGKTTSSINLAAASALAGARVLLLDTDPLSNISTSLNLAEHPQRQSLRQAGVDLPGVLVRDVLPGLDVLSPYEDGGCSDDDLDQLLGLLGAPDLQECYGTLIVDTPPFLGANPAQLLATCDEFILVLRAEPMAYRTLPAFLELVQRSKGPQNIKLRGFLLTLPQGEQPGGRWERELRGRLGTRILPLVVPFDESAAQVALFGQIITHSNPQSPVSHSYNALVESLAMAGELRAKTERVSGVEALLLASAARKSSPVRRPVTTPASVPVPLVPISPPAAEGFTPSRRRRTPAASAPEVPIARQRTPAYVPLVEPVVDVPPSPIPAPAPTAATGTFPMGMGLLWVGLAIVLGVALRFLKLPDYMAPVLVGVGVGAVVVVVARYMATQDESKAISPPPPTTTPLRSPAGTPARQSGLKRRSKPTRKVGDK